MPNGYPVGRIQAETMELRVYYLGISLRKSGWAWSRMRCIISGQYESCIPLAKIAVSLEDFYFEIKKRKEKQKAEISI